MTSVGWHAEDFWLFHLLQSFCGFIDRWHNVQLVAVLLWCTTNIIAAKPSILTIHIPYHDAAAVYPQQELELEASS